MTSEDLRRQNASLRDRIEQALEMHPELRDGAEVVALNQDLHVEVGAPFLERTRDKLLERVQAITKDRPELEHYFDDLPPVVALQEGITSDAMGVDETAPPSQRRIDPSGITDLSSDLTLSDDPVRPLESPAPQKSVRRSRGVSPPE